MRIRFAARSNEDEWETLERTRRDIDGFLRECDGILGGARGAPLGAEQRRALERTIRDAVRRVTPDIHVELDSTDGDHRLFIAPARESGGALLAEEFVKRAAPRSTFSAVRFRPEVGVAAALGEVRERYGMDLEGARARLGFSRGHLLEAVVYAPGVSHAGDESAADAAELLVARLLGEALFHDFVGAVDVAPLPRGGSLRVVRDSATPADASLPLADVLPAAEAAIRGLYNELPEAPYHRFCERADWTMLELSPEMADDYGAMDDLALVSTMIPEATKCQLQGAPFSSVRFSKHGERFAYLKVDAVDRTVDGRHELRLALEDALNHVLVPGGVGCVVAAGLGARYVYLDLALSHLDHGVRVACERVRRVAPDATGWVLFHEMGWEDEWLAIGDHGPPPPRTARTS